MLFYFLFIHYGTVIYKVNGIFGTFSTLFRWILGTFLVDKQCRTRYNVLKNRTEQRKQVKKYSLRTLNQWLWIRKSSDEREIGHYRKENDMKNNDFLKRYVEGYYVEGEHGRMAYKNGRLISYSTPICDIDRRNKKAVVNVRKYSSTTSRMQNYLLHLLEINGYEIERYEGDDADMWDVCTKRRVRSDDVM